MGNEPDTAQLEKIAPETMSVDKTLNTFVTLLKHVEIYVCHYLL